MVPSLRPVNKTIVNLRNMNRNLNRDDTEVYKLINEERKRQEQSLELIASENYTSLSVMECLGSVLTNKYSEGLPGARYYGGNCVIDKLERLCIQRALDTFGLDTNEWGVNVQTYSGSIANVAAYASILKPHDRIMGLDLPSGGHLSHGYYTSKKKISSTSVNYESLPYTVNSDGYINYEELEFLAERFKPKLIICGASAYSRDFDYKRFREIADKNGSYLMCDMAHISGFVATKQMKNPFEYCDLVTTTTHKTLGGPRSAMIFFNKKLENKVNFSVFPGLQGGPHQNQIAAVATQLKEVSEPEFKEYIIQVNKNAKTLADSLMNYGYNVLTSGTDNHIILVDLRDKNITGDKVEKLCELVNISLNKNSVPGDVSALHPGGIRIGTSALTTRGLTENDFIKVSEFLHRAIQLANKEYSEEELDKLKSDIIEFISQFSFYQ
tara:strand:- start:1120 stop:2439 length:1320 start_codon:yes stop_codon:yes gene_type:complete